MVTDKLTIASPSRDALAATPILYDVERQVRLTSGLVEVGKFRWPTPVDIELRPLKDRIACNMALSPRPSNGRLVQVDSAAEHKRDGLERVMLLDPGRTYRLSLPAGQVRALYCEIERTALEQLLAGSVDLEGRDWQAQFKSRMPVIELLLHRMYEELREENFGSELALEAYLRALCVELARCLRKAMPAEESLRKGGLAPWRMRLLKERIFAEAPAPRITELAELCSMTVRQLSRAFKDETGQALGAFIADATMQRAARLLTQSDKPIAQIAKDLGFASSTSFSYSFRHATGVLPRDYRQRAAVA